MSIHVPAYAALEICGLPAVAACFFFIRTALSSCQAARVSESTLPARLLKAQSAIDVELARPRRSRVRPSRRSPCFDVSSRLFLQWCDTPILPVDPTTLCCLLHLYWFSRCATFAWTCTHIRDHHAYPGEEKPPEFIRLLCPCAFDSLFKKRTCHGSGASFACVYARACTFHPLPHNCHMTSNLTASPNLVTSPVGNFTPRSSTLLIGRGAFSRQLDHLVLNVELIHPPVGGTQQRTAVADGRDSISRTSPARAHFRISRA